MYQGKNKSNVDVHPNARKLPTTQKAVANAILRTKINNDEDGSRHLFMNNRYTCPQLLAMMNTEWNLRGGGTCRANRKGFPMKMLKVPNKAERGYYVRVVDP